MARSSKRAKSVPSKIVSLYVGLDYHEASIRVCVMDGPGRRPGEQEYEQ